MKLAPPQLRYELGAGLSLLGHDVGRDGRLDLIERLESPGADDHGFRD